MLLDERREPAKQMSTVAGGHGAPTRKRTSGTCNSCVSLLDARLLELGNGLFRCRIEDGEHYWRPPMRSRR